MPKLRNHPARFNPNPSDKTLDAQHEACAAYVDSQRHEGWTLLPNRFDDGGLSGGTLERPALQRLLAEIDAGRVDRIVVYKIDRLTRSLPDFARIVDHLDAAGASFVSVTQSFNTATSMGRLTLNILLSFAQFEREVTFKRIERLKGGLLSPADSGAQLFRHRLGVDLPDDLTVALSSPSLSVMDVLTGEGLGDLDLAAVAVLAVPLWALPVADQPTVTALCEHP